jgi:hypothetical protein
VLQWSLGAADQWLNNTASGAAVWDLAKRQSGQHNRALNVCECITEKKSRL